MVCVDDPRRLLRHDFEQVSITVRKSMQVASRDHGKQADGGAVVVYYRVCQNVLAAVAEQTVSFGVVRLV